MGRRGGGEAASLRFVRAKWPGGASALPQRRAGGPGQEPRARSEWGYPAGGSWDSPASRLRLLGGGETLFSSFSVVEGGREQLFWVKATGRGPALAPGLSPRCAAAGRAGGSPGRGVVPAAGWARPGMLQPAGGGAEPPGCCQGQGHDAAPRPPSCRPTAHPQSQQPHLGTLTAHHLPALHPPARPAIAGHDGAVPTPKSPQPHAQNRCPGPTPAPRSRPGLSRGCRMMWWHTGRGEAGAGKGKRRGAMSPADPPHSLPNAPNPPHCGPQSCDPSLPPSSPSRTR